MATFYRAKTINTTAPHPCLCVSPSIKGAANWGFALSSGVDSSFVLEIYEVVVPDDVPVRYNVPVNGGRDLGWVGVYFPSPNAHSASELGRPVEAYARWGTAFDAESVADRNSDDMREIIVENGGVMYPQRLVAVVQKTRLLAGYTRRDWLYADGESDWELRR